MQYNEYTTYALLIAHAKSRHAPQEVHRHVRCVCWLCSRMQIGRAHISPPQRAPWLLHTILCTCTTGRLFSATQTQNRFQPSTFSSQPSGNRSIGSDIAASSLRVRLATSPRRP